MIIIPISAANKLVSIASSPSLAPTTFDVNSLSSTFNAPIRITEASCSASSNDSCPSIVQEPPVIAVLILG